VYKRQIHSKVNFRIQIGDKWKLQNSMDLIATVWNLRANRTSHMKGNSSQLEASKWPAAIQLWPLITNHITKLMYIVRVSNNHILNKKKQSLISRCHSKLCKHRLLTCRIETNNCNSNRHLASKTHSSSTLRILNHITRIMLNHISRIHHNFNKGSHSNNPTKPVAKVLMRLSRRNLGEAIMLNNLNFRSLSRTSLN